MPTAVGAWIVLVVLRALKVLIVIRAKRLMVMIWAKEMPSVLGTGRMPVIFRTNLLGLIWAGLALVVNGVPPMHWDQCQVRLQEWGGPSDYRARAPLGWWRFTRPLVLSPY